MVLVVADETLTSTTISLRHGRQGLDRRRLQFEAIRAGGAVPGPHLHRCCRGNNVAGKPRSAELLTEHALSISASPHLWRKGRHRLRSEKCGYRSLSPSRWARAVRQVRPPLSSSSIAVHASTCGGWFSALSHAIHAVGDNAHDQKRNRDENLDCWIVHWCPPYRTVHRRP